MVYKYKYPYVGLTDFLAFTNKAGVKKVKKIDSLLNRGDYHVGKDFYKKLRDKIIEVNKKESDRAKKDLVQVLNEISPKKIGHYEILIKGYLKFFKGKEVKWIDPPNSIWSHNDLSIRVNPEIGLEIDGVKTAIKLYFSQEKIDSENGNVVLSIMDQCLQERGFKPAILDIRRSKILYLTGKSSQYKVFVESEANLFSSLLQDLLQAA